MTEGLASAMLTPSARRTSEPRSPTDGLRRQLLLALDERGHAPEPALAEVRIDLELHLGRADEAPPAFGRGLAHDLLELAHQGLLGLLEPLARRTRTA